MTPVGIVGFRGYSGAELVQILSRHPHVEPVLLEHRDTEDRPRPLGHAGPRRLNFTVEEAGAGPARPSEASGTRERSDESGVNLSDSVVPAGLSEIKAAGLAAVFLATPADVSMNLAAGLLAAGIKVIDLSGAFRLGTPENYQRWYKEPHTQPALLEQAVYGLPEFCRARIPSAQLISNPGCYPTAANLAIKPLIDAVAIARESGIVCDGKSGVSGAGRKPSLKTSFCEVTENFSAYSILDHRHVPEVLRISGLDEAEFSFTAQLIPIHRGILETIYFRASESISSAEDLLGIYQKRYAHEPFVRLYAPGQVPDLAQVNHTNFCDLGFKYDPATRRAVVVSAIDNLVKGAAGQAVQNLNLALGFPETAGLIADL